MSLREDRKQQSHQALLDATLALSSQGRTFSTISLREVTHAVGLVPTAFYRHFQDMNQLGLELLDQVAIHLKGILNQLGQAYLYQPNTRTQTGIELFFQAVDFHPEPWIFFVAERWGGSEVLRSGIEREIHFLAEDVMHELVKMQSTRHIQASQDLQALAQMLIELSLNWAMGWIHIQHQADPELRRAQSNAFKTQSMLQMQLLLHGVLHWYRQPDETTETASSESNAAVRPPA
jgi:AcrR family transcriptional regulator